MSPLHRRCWLWTFVLLGCSGGSEPEPTYSNPYAQPLQASAPAPASPAATAAPEGPAGTSGRPSTTAARTGPAPAGRTPAPAPRSPAPRPRPLSIVPASADDGPPLPYEDYFVWTRQSGALLEKMAGLYEAMVADGDVSSRVGEWSDACHDFEEVYRDVMTTPPPSAKMRGRLTTEVLPELDAAITRAQAAREAASGVIEGEIDTFIDYGRAVRKRFAGDPSSESAASSRRSF